jgi:hypothetical protein
MAKVTVVDVVPNENGFLIRVNFDYTALIGTVPETYSVDISKPEYLFWKESNVAGTIDDFIRSLVRPHYEKLLAQKNLALQLNLVNKELTW